MQVSIFLASAVAGEFELSLKFENSLVHRLFEVKEIVNNCKLEMQRCATNLKPFANEKIIGLESDLAKKNARAENLKRKLLT